MVPKYELWEPVSCIPPGQFSMDTEELCQQRCSNAPHCLIVRRDCFALLPARSHESLSALSCFQGMLLAASLALCQAWFWLCGNAKIIECSTYDSGEGLRGNGRAWSWREHPRWKQMQSVMGRELSVVRLWKGPWSKPGFAEEQLQPGAVSSGVKEGKKPKRTCGRGLGNFDTGTYCLIW